MSLAKYIKQYVEDTREAHALLTEVSAMIRDMGYDAPIIGESLRVWGPKLHAFVKAMHEKRDE